MNQKKVKRPTRYTQQLLDIVDQYVEKTGSSNVDLKEVARWAYENGLMDKPAVDIVKMLAKSLATACRQDYIVDENGEPVRHRHAIKEKHGEKQLTFWFKMEDATPEQMRLSGQGRRTGTLMDVLQLDRDMAYYNSHYNPGDPIEMDYNFNPDVEERRMPTEYPDSAPE